jgi:hypothetical protein
MKANVEENSLSEGGLIPIKKGVKRYFYTEKMVKRQYFEFMAVIIENCHSQL